MLTINLITHIYNKIINIKVDFEVNSISEATDHFILSQKRFDHNERGISVGDIVQTNKLTKLVHPKKGGPPFNSTTATVVVKKFINHFGAQDYYYYYVLYRERLYKGWAGEEYGYDIKKYEQNEGVIFPVGIIKDIQDNRLEGNSSIVLITKDAVISFIPSTEMFNFMRKYSWFTSKWGEKSAGFGRSMTTKVDPFLTFMGM